MLPISVKHLVKSDILGASTQTQKPPDGQAAGDLSCIGKINFWHVGGHEPLTALNPSIHYTQQYTADFSHAVKATVKTTPQ